MTKVLIATDKPFAKEAIVGIQSIFAPLHYEVELLEKYPDKATLLAHVAGVDAMIIRSDLIDTDVVAAADQLKIVVRAGAGYDNIDLDACTAKGIVAMNTPGQNSNAVAELVIGMMIYRARNFFNGTSGSELRGKKLWLHAFWNVAKAVATIAKGFGMDIYAFDPFASKEAVEAAGIHYVAKMEDLYSTCQYVSLHMPATAETKWSVNADLLSRMPKWATLINTARKEVVDEAGILKMFAEREDFAYLADVEPDAKAEIIEKYAGRYFFTPNKMWAQTAEANSNAWLAAANQIVNFIEKWDKTFQVNP